MDAYYRPYAESDSEYSDSEFSYASRPENSNPDYIDPREPSPDFAALANALQAPLSLAAGPSFSTITEEDEYSKRRLDTRTEYSHYVPPPPLPPGSNAGDMLNALVQRDSNEIQTVVMLQSRDRDKTVYPQPTNCQLFLPRIYRHLAGFSIAQINLTSAFFYFSKAKQNIAIECYEQGTVQYQPILIKPPTVNDASGNPLPLYKTSLIREGSYNIDQLMTEMNIQLNLTPLFYDFLNGFQDFYNVFVTNGDYSLNFNYPGDYYYDSVNKVFVPNPTRQSIVAYYFQSQYANRLVYTISEVRIAYYYPVLKEVLLDPTTDLTQYNFTGTPYDISETINYLIYNFQGLDDSIALTVITNNLTLLDTYRLLHTFRYYLVNKYVCYYNPTNNRVSIQCPSLNTSLVNLLNAQYNIYLAQLLNKYQIAYDTYKILNTLNTQLLSLIQAMYNLMQLEFAKYFAINYGSFSIPYYANQTNTVLTRNGLDASGIPYTYNPFIQGTPTSVDIAADFSKDPPYLWPRMKVLGGTEGPPRNMGSTNEIYPNSSNFPYTLGQSNINLTTHFVSPSYTIYTDPRTNSGDILTTIQPAKYTIFQFRSKCRQTLQVETLPRQLAWRYPVWNSNNIVPDPVKQLFDMSYCFVSSPNISTSKIQPRDISYNAIYGWSNLYNTDTLYGATFEQSSNLWGSSVEQITVANSNGRFYTFQTPLPVDPATKAINGYKYDMNITITSPQPTGFATDLLAFFYQDVAAFSADLTFPRQERPIHYKGSLYLSTASLSNTYSFRTYANETYFVLVRPSTITPAATQYQIIPWFNDTAYSTLTFFSTFDTAAEPQSMLSNMTVAITADQDFIKIPIFPSTLWAAEPPTELVNIPLESAAVPIGYDTNGISTDMTDYIPFRAGDGYHPNNPNATIRVDPITNYIFQYSSPYNLTNDSYIYPGSLNALLTPTGANPYTPTTVANRQYKIANYNATTFIQNASDSEGTRTYTDADITPYVSSPYTSTTTGGSLNGYTYTGTSSILTLASGVCGFMFLPGSGTWAVDRITFKTNFINPAKSTNRYIYGLGVFYTSEICFLPITSISLSNAIAICLLSGTSTYTSGSNLGFDPAEGTYYTFSTCQGLVSRSNAIISGFSQNAKQFIPISNSYYSVIPFTFTSPAYTPWDINTVDIATLSNDIATKTGESQVQLIQNLMGSPVAYPYANHAFVSTTFYDGQYPPTPTSVVLSSSNGNASPNGPPLGYDESISVYEQSVPYANSHIHYEANSDIINDSNAFSAWSNLPLLPTALLPSIPNYMVFQGDEFAITKYTTYATTIQNITPDYVLSQNSFQFKGQLPFDLIYPDTERTAMIAATGTKSNYVFVGASNIDGTVSQLRFKLYNPATGILIELQRNPNYVFSNSWEVQHFVFNNSNAWFMSAVDIPNSTVYLYGDTEYSSSYNTTFTYSFPGLSQSELQLDPAGSFVYFSAFNTGFTSFTMYSLNSGDPGYIRSNVSGYTIDLTQTQGVFPPLYNQIAVTLNTVEEVLLIDTKAPPPFHFYKIMSYHAGATAVQSNTIMAVSAQQYLRTPKRIYGGGGGTKWITFDTDPLVLGNRNDAYSSPISINIAWQIFFPTIKIEMRQLTVGESPIIDLTNITYPEYFHSAMFGYNNYSTLVADISANLGQWGNESNFAVSDISFNGFQFNSYLMDFPLLPNDTNPSYETDYYLAVRGWLPTEQYQTMLRFYMPNRYDFGFMRFLDISAEVPLALSNPSLFNPTYLYCLEGFNSNFIFTNTIFGSNASIGYAGSNLSSSNFGDFYTQYVGYYSTLSTQSYILSNIQSTLNGSINQFIATDLQYILPSNALQRQRYTDPLLFQILWKSQLSPQYVTLDDEWGLGWNLGFPKEDTGFATIQTGSSFYRILEDFIYLRLNPEFNINRMDAGGKEDYKKTREPSGITNQYYCKLLLTSFGGNATTFIHNPITFNPLIYSLTKLEFQWLDKNKNLINNNDAEWDMVVNITERINNMTIKDEKDYVPMDASLASPIIAQKE